MKKTGWFADDVTPVHEGLYETRVEQAVSWSVWMDGLWHFACSDDPALCVQRANEGYVSFWQVREWRGLTQETK